jgi:hypothetical protein
MDLQDVHTKAPQTHILQAFHPHRLAIKTNHILETLTLKSLIQWVHIMVTPTSGARCLIITKVASARIIVIKLVKIQLRDNYKICLSDHVGSHRF